jgi:hypothetical protein
LVLGMIIVGIILGISRLRSRKQPAAIGH